jgi:hypothetical protein
VDRGDRRLLELLERVVVRCSSEMMIGLFTVV